MKLIRSDAEQFRFEISREEKDLLLHLLRLYPLVPATHHQLSRARQIPDREENQQLLEEVLNAQRRQNRKHIEALLNAPQRFTVCAAGYQVGFNRGEMEWLLQGLNDVRLGSWLALGSPDEHQEGQQRLSQPTASHALTMDLAGFFEMGFLHAFSGELQAGHE